MHLALFERDTLMAMLKDCRRVLVQKANAPSTRVFANDMSQQIITELEARGDVDWWQPKAETPNS